MGSLEYEGEGQDDLDGGLEDDESGPMIVTEGA